MRVVTWLNLRLPVNKRIQVIDNFRWEEFGLKEHPIMDKLEKDGFDAYPFFFMDGILVEPAQKEILRPFLESYLKSELMF